MDQKVLLVDDRPENILVLESTLERQGLEFVKADCGEEALRKLLKNQISLILLDVQMPGMDGFEVAEFVRNNPSTKHIPIIFISAINKDQKHIFKGYASGAIDYMFKPFDPDILKSKVEILLDLDKQRRTVESQKDELARAKHITDSILQNVNEGLFLLDDEFRISSHYSRALEDILESENLSGENLIEFLTGKVPSDLQDASTEYFKLSFDGSISDSSLTDLNPLDQVKYQISENGRPGTPEKHLKFDARRVYKNGDISYLIVTVRDITQKVLLEQKMAEMEKESRKRLDNLLSIIHVDPKMLRDFIESVERDLQESKLKLTAMINGDHKPEHMEFLFRSMHQIKGNAAILDLKQFMDDAHGAEELIKKLQTVKKAKKSDYASICSAFEKIEDNLNAINQIISNLQHIYQHFRPKREYEIELLVKSVKNLIENLQQSTGKKAELEYNDFDGVVIPYNCRLDLKDILVQLTRNSFCHGIEKPAVRKKLGKSPTGRITIQTFKTDTSIGFSFRDDGCGLQPDKIRQALISSGKYKNHDIANWNDDQINMSIFQAGITTAEKADTTGGRGIGMDIVKQKVEKQGGEIEIETKPDKYTQFRISFPAEQRS